MVQNRIPVFVYNPDTLEYEDAETGEPIDPALVEGVVADRVNEGFDRLDAILAAVASAATIYVLSDWQESGVNELVLMHYQAAILGAGGLANMTPAIWKQTASIVAGELRYWEGLARDIANGAPESDVRRRMRMYANAIRTSYWNARTETARHHGYNQERRVLNPADHCDDCLAYAAQGWVEIGTLPEPGDGSQCLRFCKCDKEYRTISGTMGVSEDEFEEVF